MIISTHSIYELDAMTNSLPLLPEVSRLGSGTITVDHVKRMELEAVPYRSQKRKEIGLSSSFHPYAELLIYLYGFCEERVLHVYSAP